MIAIALFFMSQLAGGLELVGEAKDYSGRVLYVEKHTIQTSENGLSQTVKTEYRKPGGEVFAEMSLDFTKNPLLPDMVFEDRRFEIKDEMKFEPKDQTIFLRHAVKGKKPKEARFKSDSQMVSTQAFDNFVKKRFSELEKKHVPVHFVVPAKVSHFRFEAFEDKESKTDSERTFRLRVSNFFLKLFVEDIRVRYDAKSKHLVFYQGVSNIRDDKGRSQKVKITYETLDSVKIN